MSYDEQFNHLMMQIEKTRFNFTRKTNVKPTCLYLGHWEYGLLLSGVGYIHTQLDSGELPSVMNMHVLRVNVEHHINVS